MENFYTSSTRTIYVKITALSWNEQTVLEELTGRIVNGGSINLDGASSVRRTCSFSFLSETLATDLNWGYKTKAHIQIGVENDQSEYKEFDLGIYVITSFSSSISTSGCTISITARDKMCLLNGDVGGVLTAQTQFDSIDEIDAEGNSVVSKIPIKNIIINSVHQYAGEPLENIEVSDLDGYGYELLEYRGDSPLFLIRQANSKEYEQGTFDSNMKCYIGGVQTTISDPSITYDPLVGALGGNTPTGVTFENGLAYCLAKIVYGETAGYRITDIIYPSDLILNAGEAITSLYDKLVAMLGNYEYFYSTEGKFIFRRKTTIDNSETYEPSFTFDDTTNVLITAASRNPDLSNLRNDFVVWGQRDSATGDLDLGFHARYAIASKPTSYYSNRTGKTYDASTYDWRELIYQMAQDYNLGYQESTGYEMFYTDLDGFWRQIYYPQDAWAEDYANAGDDKSTFELLYGEQWSDNYSDSGWHRNKTEDPGLLTYWLDFSDDAALSEFSISSIGLRTKVVNDTSIKSIFTRDIPSVVFMNKGEAAGSDNDFKYFQLGGFEEAFSISAQGKTAAEEIDDLVYNYTYAQETLTLTTLPIYSLEPNSKIRCWYGGEYTDYVATRITIPLTYNGTMTITASKARQSNSSFEISE